MTCEKKLSFFGFIFTFLHLAGPSRRPKQSGVSACARCSTVSLPCPTTSTGLELDIDDTDHASA